MIEPPSPKSEPEDEALPADDATGGRPLQRFNLDTMSGIHTGTRTQIFQQLRLHPAAAAEPQSELDADWARLSWYENPPSAQLHLHGEGDANREHPLLQIEEPEGQNLVAALEEQLRPAGRQLAVCGNCVNWTPLALPRLDHVSQGRCHWIDTDPAASLPPRASEELEAPLILRRQSALALSCAAWRRRTGPIPAAVPAEKLEPADEPQPPSAWHRLKQRLGFARPTRAHVRWSDAIAEQSGVGAGTESCLCCQGRIANLGAHTVDTAEGDKRTASVWRCRLCHTFYLNDFVDRWERTSSLETEERFYRLAPAEALHLLAHIAHGAAPHQPGSRTQTAHDLAAWLRALREQRAPLSHQVRRGR